MELFKVSMCHSLILSFNLLFVVDIQISGPDYVR